MRIFIDLILAAIIFATFPVRANETYSAEIQYLIDFVSSSGCDFVRNGKMHDPKEAVKHIQKKYDYFRDKIDSAEKFIELAATQSTMSKKKYTIRCPDKPDIESWFWLQTELARHRAAIAE